MSKQIDQLPEDPVLANQLWCCVSFISPETLKNCNFRGIKIRGVYATKEDATKRAEFLQKIDPDFNIYIGEVGKWLGWDPDPNTIDDQVYREQKLQDIMNNYNKNRDKAKELQEERKRDMLDESVRLEAQKKATVELIDGPGSAMVAESASVIALEKKQLEEKTQDIKKSELDLNSLDSKLNELQAHYKNLLNQKKKV
jgi:hypothetical protein